MISWQHITYKPSKLCQTGLVFGLWVEFISRSIKHDYISLNAATMICATMVNTHTHRGSFWHAIVLAQLGELRMPLKALQSPLVCVNNPTCKLVLLKSCTRSINFLKHWTLLSGCSSWCLVTNDVYRFHQKSNLGGQVTIILSHENDDYFQPFGTDDEFSQNYHNHCTQNKPFSNQKMKWKHRKTSTINYA